TIIFGFGG
nr:Chain A, pohlianin C [Jatropha]